MNGVTAEVLILDLYGHVMRRLSERLQVHHEGLRQAANYARKIGAIDNQMQNRLLRLDNAYHLVRHVDLTLCKRDLSKVDELLDEYDRKRRERNSNGAQEGEQQEVKKAPLGGPA